VCVERVGSLGASLTVSGGLLLLGLVLLLGTCVGRLELLPTPLRGAHGMSRPQEKTSVEVSNLCNGEMCSNYSLSICPYVSATIHRPARGAGSAGAALSDIQFWHLPKACHRRFHVGGGRSRTFSSGTTRGLVVDVFTLMVGAPGPSAPTPPGGLASTFSR
jgi:hypothetical protein